MSPGMALVIVCKAITCLLLAGAFVLLILAGKEPTDVFSDFVNGLFDGNPPGFVVGFVVSQTEFLTPAKVYRLAGATLAYSILEGTEAVGLAARRPWAEWLTILVTASFLPFEIHELVTKPTPVKAGTLVINAAILVYLVVRQFQERRASPGS